jgi:hypothetical protein
MEYEYASERRMYYPKGDATLRSGARYLADTLSSEQRKVFYTYANNTSSGAPFKTKDGKDLILKREGSDYVVVS